MIRAERNPDGQRHGGFSSTRTLERWGFLNPSLSATMELDERTGKERAEGFGCTQDGRGGTAASSN